MQNSPKVSVVMSVYNGARYLRDAIDSILGQTFRDFEFIIVNDGSTDSSRDIILSYEDSRIYLINNEANLGLPVSLNKGIRIANGEYIARQDADDISLPERLELQAAFLDEHSNVGVIGSRSLVLHNNNPEVQPVRYPVSDIAVRAWLTRGANAFDHSAVLIRRSAVKAVGGYDENLDTSQDYDLWFRLAESWRINNMRQYLVIKRRHEAAISELRPLRQAALGKVARTTSQQRLTKGEDEFGRKLYSSENGANKNLGQALARLRLLWGLRLTLQGEVSQGMALIRTALATSPFDLVLVASYLIFQELFLDNFNSMIKKLYGRLPRSIHRFYRLNRRLWRRSPAIAENLESSHNSRFSKAPRG